jgi:hypothetical protein
MQVCDMFSAFLNDTRFPPLISMYQTNHRTDKNKAKFNIYITQEFSMHEMEEYLSQDRPRNLLISQRK